MDRDVNGEDQGDFYSSGRRRNRCRGRHRKRSAARRGGISREPRFDVFRWDGTCRPSRGGDVRRESIWGRGTRRQGGRGCQRGGAHDVRRVELRVGVGEKTEGWSFLYSSRADFACFNSRSAIQESSSAEYPFHRIKNMRADGEPRWRKIFSISYSSSPSIKSGGGAGKFRPWTSFSR